MVLICQVSSLLFVKHLNFLFSTAALEKISLVRKLKVPLERRKKKICFNMFIIFCSYNHCNLLIMAHV